MITPLKTGAFWSTGKRNTRRTAMGATAIVVLLALISMIVWLSPSDSPVRKLVGDAVKPISTNQQLKTEKSNLLSQLVSMKSTMSTQTAKLTSQQTQLNAALGKAKALQASLSKAKAAESKAEGQVASYKSQLAAGSHGSGVSSSIASSGDATTTTPASGVTTAPPPATTKPNGPVAVQTPSLASIINPTSRYFGLYTDQSPFSFSDSNEVASDVGAEPNVSGYFQGFDAPFRADAVQSSWAKGELPMMTWETQPSVNTPGQDLTAYSLANITKGNFDAYITAYAKAIVANGQPMAIRLDQEMNANWYPWGNGTNGNTGGPEFVAMWQHVHDIFQAQGANNLVAWVWAPNRVNNLSATSGFQEESYTKSFYPGTNYVDWVGMSAYLRPPYSSGETYSFDHTFTLTLKQLRDIAPGKKIILAEIGASEIGGQKSKWITDLFQNLSLPANSDIIGFDWFNHTVTSSTSGIQYTNDWRINSSSSSIAAFKAGIARKDIGYDLGTP
ncbi:hypothetical protein AX769_13455 [Frondihabitans sp. PAMC 28766]|nr:hypothetical protein AX769_13455 [Frondihabitans sp. PAMC 28766]